MTSRFIIITFLISFNYNSSAQTFFKKGWVVTPMGDTLHGFIADDNQIKLGSEVSFKKQKKDNPKTFKPTELRSFYIEPNQYFESHPVTIKNEKGLRNNDLHQFLIRSEAGYLSVFRTVVGEIVFIKKEGDSTVQPLFMTVKVKDALNKNQSDTLTNERLDGYAGTTLTFKYDYIYLLAKYFNEGQSYSPTIFPLEETRIIEEVRRYNKAVHPNFKPNPPVIKEKWRPIWSMAVNFFKPIRPIGFEENSFYTAGTKTRLSPSIWGYEILGGLHGSKKMKGISLELGYYNLSNVLYKYTYSNISSSSNVPQYFDGTYENKVTAWLLRVNYTALSSARFSPYFSAIILDETDVITDIRTERGTSNIQYLAYDSKNTSIITCVGLQYTPTRQHIVRTEVNFSLGDLSFNKAIFKVGYQYRFGKFNN
jgi:hypothetical protein